MDWSVVVLAFWSGYIIALTRRVMRLQRLIEDMKRHVDADGHWYA